MWRRHVEHAGGSAHGFWRRPRVLPNQRFGRTREHVRWLNHSAHMLQIHPFGVYGRRIAIRFLTTSGISLPASAQAFATARWLGAKIVPRCDDTNSREAMRGCALAWKEARYHLAG